MSDTLSVILYENLMCLWGRAKGLGFMGRVLSGSAIFAGEYACGWTVVDAVGSVSETLATGSDVNL